jgi:type I restriction enzyme M protein
LQREPQGCSCKSCDGLDPREAPARTTLVLRQRAASKGGGSTPNDRGLDVGTLEGWLWEAACQIRGPLDAPKFKDYILPLIFIKRLSDVFEDEVGRVGEELGDPTAARSIVDADHKMVRFYVPPSARWAIIALKTTGLGEHLTDAMRAVARENPKLQGVIDSVDFNATTAGQRIVDDQHLTALVQTLSRYRLGLDDVEPDILGRAYEYLLRKFAEGQGQSAGEFYTPPEVARLMARFLEPEPGMSVYDPACGSGGLLIKCHLRLLKTHGKQVNGHVQLPPNAPPLGIYGQEINAATFAMARMNAFIHDMDAEIALGDTMNRPGFTDDEGRLRHFDIVTANPMWNQDFPLTTYQHDTHDRFRFGIPPASTGDWGWIQHMYASLKTDGRMAVVLDTGSVSRGSGYQGSNRERDIRKAFVNGSPVTKSDVIEAVVLLPENLFYNTNAPGIILLINSRKRHPGEILLINAAMQFTKGRPKNRLGEEHIQRIVDLYQGWRSEEGISAVITLAEAIRSDYNLSPSRYIASKEDRGVLAIEEALVLLHEAEEKRVAADDELDSVLKQLQLGGRGNA